MLLTLVAEPLAQTQTSVDIALMRLVVYRYCMMVCMLYRKGQILKVALHVHSLQFGEAFYPLS